MKQYYYFVKYQRHFFFNLFTFSGACKISRYKPISSGKELKEMLAKEHHTDSNKITILNWHPIEDLNWIPIGEL